jgi:hypothetical protein
MVASSCVRAAFGGAAHVTAALVRVPPHDRLFTSVVQICIVDISIFSLIFGTVMPDFTQVYSFLASIFYPCTSGHLQKLKDMNPIDVETVCDHGCTSFF